MVEVKGPDSVLRDRQRDIWLIAGVHGFSTCTHTRSGGGPGGDDCPVSLLHEQDIGGAGLNAHVSSAASRSDEGGGAQATSPMDSQFFAYMYVHLVHDRQLSPEASVYSQSRLPDFADIWFGRICAGSIRTTTCLQIVFTLAVSRLTALLM